MQHIGIRWETETGETVADFDVNGVDVRIVTRAPASSSCLRFIDPYGDTIFNQLQLPVLVSEFEQLRDATSEHELRAHIERMVAFFVPLNGSTALSASSGIDVLASLSPSNVRRVDPNE